MKTFLHVFQSSAVFSLVEKKLVFQQRGPEAAPAPEAAPVSKAEAAPKKPDEGAKAEKAEKKMDQKEHTKKSLDWSKKALERDRAYKPVHRHEGFKLGKADLSVEESKKLPNIDPTLEYRAVGGVDSSTYSPKAEHEVSWYGERSVLATQFLALYTDGKLYTDVIPEDMTEVLGAMDALSRLPVGADAKTVKERLSKFSVDSVYGAKGAYNFLLALKRANVVVPHNKEEKVLYDLKVGQGVAPKARFTELGVKKEVQVPEDKAAPAEKPPEQAPAPKKAPPTKLKDIPSQNKPGVLPETTKESLSSAVLAAEKSVQATAEEYRQTYNFPVVVEEGVDRFGNPVFTMTIDLGGNVKKNVYLRVVNDAAGIRYSLASTPIQNSASYTTLEDGKRAFRAEAEKILTKTTEKLRENAKAQLDAFFGSEKYLHTLDPDVDSQKVTGSQQIGGEKGVDFSDAQYVVLMKNSSMVYVYMDPVRDYVYLQVAQASSDPKGGLHKLSLGDVSFDNLGTQKSKDAFALKLLSVIRNGVAPAPKPQPKPAPAPAPAPLPGEHTTTVTVEKQAKPAPKPMEVPHLVEAPKPQPAPALAPNLIEKKSEKPVVIPLDILEVKDLDRVLDAFRNRIAMFKTSPDSRPGGLKDPKIFDRFVAQAQKQIDLWHRVAREALVLNYSHVTPEMKQVAHTSSYEGTIDVLVSNMINDMAVEKDAEKFDPSFNILKVSPAYLSETSDRAELLALRLGDYLSAPEPLDIVRTEKIEKEFRQAVQEKITYFNNAHAKLSVGDTREFKKDQLEYIRSNETPAVVEDIVKDILNKKKNNGKVPVIR